MVWELCKHHSYSGIPASLFSLMQISLVPRPTRASRVGLGTRLHANEITNSLSIFGASLSEPHIVVFSGCPSGGCLFAARLAYDRISKWKIVMLRRPLAGSSACYVLRRNYYRVQPATFFRQCYKLRKYKLETPDRRERMGSVLLV